MDTPLSKVRKLMRVTQSQVAIAVGLSQSAYSRIESGESSKAQADSAEKISRFFGGAVNEIHVLYPERFPDFLGDCGKKS